MRSQNQAILMVVAGTVFTATGQIFLKTGTNELFRLQGLSILVNYWLWAGYLLYSLSSVLFIVALKKAPLSILYPCVASTYVWVTFLSPLFFRTDQINAIKVAGVLSIVLGVSLIGISSRK
jgi:multidrug transporter EmrE-like cation transporter